MNDPILFDFDGTLVDTLPLYLKAYDQALKEQGLVFSSQKIVDTCFGKTEKTICHHLGISGQTKTFTQTYFTNVAGFFNQTKIFDHVLTFLRAAKEKQIKLGIISFAYQWYLDKMIKKLDLNQYFDIIISFNDVQNPKPDPEAVILACQKLQRFKIENSVVVGDSYSDILMGQSAGSKTVLFHPQSYSLFYNLVSLQKTHPDYTVQNFKQLKSLLLG